MNRIKNSPERVVRIGLDIAKNIFQLHCVDKNNKCVIRKRLGRSEMILF